VAGKLNITLKKFPYSYLPYEKRLLTREAAAIGKIKTDDASGLQISVNANQVKAALSRLHRLTYFSHFSVGTGPVVPTQQFLLETTANGSCTANRQSTRYSTHGFHDYKGKFHPQIARYLMGRSELTTSSFVLDPFAGSGTVLVEAVHYGCNAIGVESNPLAVLVGNSKLKLLTCSDRELKRFHGGVQECIAKLGTRKSINTLASDLDIDTATLTYLQSWFAPAILLLILEFRTTCRHRLGPEWVDTADGILSSLIREVSQQEPADLRIRRRKEQLTRAPVAAMLSSSVENLISRTLAARKLLNDAPTSAIELAGDSRCLNSVLASAQRVPVDCIITSPPYATALPYIDTSRLSLVALGLCTAPDLRRLERDQIGNREISPYERKQAESEMERKLQSLPRQIGKFIHELVRKHKNSDAGFRKLNMPALLVQYFTDMKSVLTQTHVVLSRTGTAYWLVGPNRTNAGEKWLYIDTPQWIGTIAESVGFTISIDELDAYQRFGLHQRNGIRQEFLICMRPV
jgi:site-specific DNA-methyltransferase (cytosine-N4-specific)